MALTQAQKDAAKRRRDKIMEAAKRGGYEPQKREGTGMSEKRTSKKGTTYYYTPWSKLTKDQKDKRIEQSKKYAANTREMARRYRAEHGISKK